MYPITMACEHLYMKWETDIYGLSQSAKWGCSAVLNSPSYGSSTNSTKWYFSSVCKPFSLTTLKLHRETSGEKLHAKGVLTLKYSLSNVLDERITFDNIMQKDVEHIDIISITEKKLVKSKVTLMCDVWVMKLPETEDKSVQTFTTFCKTSWDMQKMFENQELSDLILICGTECEIMEIRAHKCVLSARSPVFAEEIRGNIYKKCVEDIKQKDIVCKRKTESVFKQEPCVSRDFHDRIKITDIDPEVLLKLVSFIYSGQVNADTFSMARDLYYAANKYALFDLKDICREFIISFMSTSTATEILILADKYQDKELKRKALMYIVSEFKENETSE